MNSIKRFFKSPETSYFLFGPRGTGKSTWVQKHYPKAYYYIDLLMPDQFRKYAANPEDLVEIIQGLTDIKTVIIDEVQKIPELLSVVHAIIEKKKGVQFILTGSSSRKLKKIGVDLLAGRAINKAMHPFLAAELGEHFTLDAALKFGMLPLVWDTENREEVLRSYVDLYVINEVQLEGLVRNIGSFSRFLNVMAFSHGNVMNVSNIARQSEVKRPTVINYIEILQDLLLAHQLPIFTKRAQRMLTAHPKFYFF